MTPMRKRYLRGAFLVAVCIVSCATRVFAAGINYGNEPPNFDPPASWRPYAASSPWNQRLPDYAHVDSANTQKMQWLFSAAFGGVSSVGAVSLVSVPWTAATGAVSGGQYPFYFARYSDPVVTLNCTAGYGVCPLQGVRIHVPAAAQAATNSDGHIVLIEPGAVEVDVWQWGTNENTGSIQRAPWRSGEIVNIGWGGGTNVVSSSGWDEGDNGGSASLSGSDGMGGQIRIPELIAGVIPHAIRAETFCSPVPPVYPSQAYPGTNTQCNGALITGLGPVAVGTRLWLNTQDYAINAYRLTNLQKMLLHALHDYGMFVTDDNGYSALNFGAIETAQPGVIYGNDIVDRYEAANFPAVGGSFFALFTQAQFQTYILPYLRVLAPCVNVGFPTGQC